MQSITEEIKQNLRATVARFIELTIGEEDPKNLCFCACFPIMLFLKINGINCSLTGGSVNDIRHFGITVNEFDNIIIDPTIRHFKPLDDSIYIGPLTREYSPDDASFDETFYWAFKFWVEPILYRPRSHQEKPKWVDERSNFFNVKFAMIRNQEIAQKKSESVNFQNKRLCKLYSATIFKFLNVKIQKDQDYLRNLQATLPQAFNELLNKAKREE